MIRIIRVVTYRALIHVVRRKRIEIQNHHSFAPRSLVTFHVISNPNYSIRRHVNQICPLISRCQPKPQGHRPVWNSWRTNSWLQMYRTATRLLTHMYPSSPVDTIDMYVGSISSPLRYTESGFRYACVYVCLSLWSSRPAYMWYVLGSEGGSLLTDDSRGEWIRLPNHHWNLASIYWF